MSNAVETKRYIDRDGKRYQVEVFYDENNNNNPRDENDCYQTVIALRKERNYRAVEQDLDYYVPSALCDPHTGQVDSNKFKKWIAVTGGATSCALDGTPLVRYAFLNRAFGGALVLTYPENAGDGEMFDGIIVVTLHTAGDTSIKETEHYTELLHDGRPVPDLWIECELEEYNNWAAGNVFGYVTSEVTECDHGDEHYDEVDSCWGFITDDIDYVFAEAKHNMDLQESD